MRKYSETGLDRCLRETDEHAAGIEWVRNEFTDSSTRLNNSFRELSVRIDTKCDTIEKRLEEVSEVVFQRMEAGKGTVQELKVGEGKTEVIIQVMTYYVVYILVDYLSLIWAPLYL